MSNKIVVLMAPSGAGKTTIARYLLEHMPDLKFSVSATTRPKRPEETDGVHYHFLSEDAFMSRVESGDFLEFEEVYKGRFYGTLKTEVDRLLEHCHVLLDVEVLGAANVKKAYGDQALLVYIRPPSLETLRERLLHRGTEADAIIEERIDRAREEMILADRQSDQTVINDELETAQAETLAVIKTFLYARTNSASETPTEDHAH